MPPLSAMRRQRGHSSMAGPAGPGGSAAGSTLERLALVAVAVVFGADLVTFLDALVLELVEGLVIIDVDGDGIAGLDVIQGGFGRLAGAGDLQFGDGADHLDGFVRGNRRHGQGGGSEGDGNEQ